MRPGRSVRRGAEEKPPSRLDAWLGAHPWLVVGVVLLLSLLIRVACFLELNQGPCVWQHRWAQTDMNFFDRWARDIAAGDWLTDQSLHPHHDWHRLIALEYLEERPEEAARLAALRSPDGSPVDPSTVLWDRWYGGKRFHQEPLYPYLIASTYTIFGHDPRWVFAWQLLLGAVGNVLIYLIGRRAFGHTAGAAAGVLAVLCGPLLFYEMILLRTSLAVFLGLLLVYVADVAMERMSLRSWLLVGLVLGLSLLLNSTFASFGVLLVILVAYRHRGEWKVASRAITAMAAGTVLCLVPVVARNMTVGAPALSLSSVGALAFICANTADYDPADGFFVSERYVPEVLAQSDNRFVPAVVETLRTHSGVASYLRQLWGKFYYTWHWYEKPNNANLYYYRLHSRVLRFLPVTFLIVAPLGIVGLFMEARRIVALGPLYALVLKCLAPLVLFYVLSRFRMPLMAALIPFAALVLVRLGESLWRRHWGAASVLAISCVLLLLWTAQPLPPGNPRIRRPDYTAPWRTYYGPEAQRAGEEGHWRKAARLLGEFLDLSPPSVREIGLAAPLRAPLPAEIPLVQLIGNVHLYHAEALAKSGRAAESLEEKRRAVELLRAAGALK